MNISLQGNIASGKSTILKRIQTSHLFPQIIQKVVPEPVNEWKQTLGLLYSDPKRYSFLMNCTALASLAKFEKNINIVTERSPDSVAHVFGKVTDMHPEEQRVLHELHNVVSNLYHNDAIVYVKSDPHRCMERMRMRGRPEEANVSLEYLQKVHDAHEQWLTHCSTPVYTVFVENKDKEQVFQDVVDVLETLQDKFKKTKSSA